MKISYLYSLYNKYLRIIALCAIVPLTNCGSDFGILLEGPPNILYMGLITNPSTVPPTTPPTEPPTTPPTTPPVTTVSTIYWSEKGGAIKQIFSDGTGEKTVINVLAPGPLFDLSLDISGNKVYWAMYSNSDLSFEIRRAGLDGSGEELFHKYFTSPNYGPVAIAIDSVNSIIYWNQYQDLPAHNDILNSALDVYFAIKWENAVPQPYTYGMCLDTLNRKIYFTANSYWDIGSIFGAGNTGTVFRGDLDSINTYVPLLSGTGPANPSIPFRGMAVDGAGGFAYYASNTTDLSIQKAGLSLENPVEWVSSQGFDIQKLALDLNGRKIYWTSGSDNSIYRADLDKQNSGIEKFLQLVDKPTGIVIVE